MKRWLTSVTALGAWAVLGASSALAQLGSYTPPQVTPGQSFSPYLNMIRNNPAVNYFGIVQPQMSTYNSLQQLQQDFRYTQQGSGSNVPLGLTSQSINNNALITGHPVMFGYSAQFFPINGSQLAGMGQGAMFGAGGTTGFGGAGFGTGGMNIGGAGPTINTPLPLGFVLPAR